MKKSLILIVGAVIILLILAVWLYLLFFGTPSSRDDLFADLGFGGAPITTVPDPVVTEPTQDTAQLDTGKALRQLTTRPVAGFSYVSTSSSLVRYVERGTGHVYEIDTQVGSERRISGTTIPQVVDAVFSDSGESVALVSESSSLREIVVGRLNAEESNVDFIRLPNNSFHPGFVSDGTLRYALQTRTGTDGYEVDIDTGESVRIFAIPIRDVTFLWHNGIYVYNRPSSMTQGALYTVTPTLEPVTPSEFGFVGGVSSGYYFGSSNVDGRVASYAIPQGDSEKTPLPITYVPEKCTKEIEGRMWCAAPFTAPSDSFMENWYRGTIQSEDVLWGVDIALGQAAFTVNFLTESGRVVDVDMITTDILGVAPIFRNKVDNTLWLYDSRIK